MGTLDFQNITKTYQSGVHAVHDFTLHVDDGEFIVLVGPSGCGKSTVLRMIAGLESISGGELKLDGRVINKLPPVQRDISLVFQDYALYGHMTVYDNVGMSMKVRHQDPVRIYDKVTAASRDLGILEYLNRFPGQLSGGQKQRVALGRAITRQPKVFLMDEPLSNLDAKMRAHTRTEIVRLQRQLNATTIYVTHDQVEAITMADRVVVMREGVIQQIGTPHEIYNTPNNLFVAGFIGMLPMNFLNGRFAHGFFEAENHAFEIPEAKCLALRDYEGKELTLGIRPEHICHTRDEGANILTLPIDSAENFGSYYHVYLHLGAAVIAGKADRSIDPTCGWLNVLFDLEKAHFFDPQTTQRIR